MSQCNNYINTIFSDNNVATFLIKIGKAVNCIFYSSMAFAQYQYQYFKIVGLVKTLRVNREPFLQDLLGSKLIWKKLESLFTIKCSLFIVLHN